MKDEQQTGLPNNPSSSPEGSKGTGSRDVQPEWFPGPWRKNSYGIESADGRQVCEFFGPCEGDNEDLIVSAPELYEALDKFCYATALAQGPEIEHALKEAYEMARAALAKARGEL